MCSLPLPILARYCFRRRLSVCLFVNTITQNICVDCHEILRVRTLWTKEEMITFWNDSQHISDMFWADDSMPELKTALCFVECARWRYRGRSCSLCDCRLVFGCTGIAAATENSAQGVNVVFCVNATGRSATKLKDDPRRNGFGGSSYVNVNLSSAETDVHHGQFWPYIVLRTGLGLRLELITNHSACFINWQHTILQARKRNSVHKIRIATDLKHYCKTFYF